MHDPGKRFDVKAIIFKQGSAPLVPSLTEEKTIMQCYLFIIGRALV